MSWAKPMAGRKPARRTPAGAGPMSTLLDAAAEVIAAHGHRPYEVTPATRPGCVSVPGALKVAVGASPATPIQAIAEPHGGMIGRALATLSAAVHPGSLGGWLGNPARTDAEVVVLLKNTAEVLRRVGLG